MRHRVLLVREWDAQVTGSGCCGKLGGINNELGDRDTFTANRRQMEKMGEVYRALRAELIDEDVEISIVDPRNMVWLIPAIVRDARGKRGLSAGKTLDQVRRGVSYNSVIFDGKVLFYGTVPGPREAVAAVRAELAELEGVGL
jgi:hypothetical protein